jgi:hypothetical protein
MTKRATERLFDGDGNLVVGVGQVIPEDVDPVDQPVHEPVDTVPAHTPAEQVLVDAGQMQSRAGDAVSTQSASAGAPKTPRKS